MPASPDYGAIQSSWLTAWRKMPTSATAQRMLASAQGVAGALDGIWEAARPTFKMVNPGLRIDMLRLERRLAILQETLDKRPESAPAVAHALLYGGVGLASACEDCGAEELEAALEREKIAPHRGDLSRAVGMVWYATEGARGWTEATWGSWIQSYIVGPAGEALTAAGIDVDTNQLAKDVMGLSRRERQIAAWQAAGIVLGTLGAGAGIVLALRGWRR